MAVGAAAHRPDDVRAGASSAGARELATHHRSGTGPLHTFTDADQGTHLSLVADPDRWRTCCNGACRPQLESRRAAGVSFRTGHRHCAGFVAFDGCAGPDAESPDARTPQDPGYPGSPAKWPDCARGLFVKCFYRDAADDGCGYRCSAGQQPEHRHHAKPRQLSGCGNQEIANPA